MLNEDSDNLWTRCACRKTVSNMCPNPNARIRSNKNLMTGPKRMETVAWAKFTIYEKHVKWNECSARLVIYWFQLTQHVYQSPANRLITKVALSSHQIVYGWKTFRFRNASTRLRNRSIGSIDRSNNWVINVFVSMTVNRELPQTKLRTFDEIRSSA